MLTAARMVPAKGYVEQARVLLTAGVTYFKGAILTIASTGLAVKAADTAGLGAFSGVLTDSVVVAAGESKYAAIERGPVWIPFAAAAQTNMGAYVYATDDDTIALTATNASPCGRVVDVKVGDSLCVDFRDGIPKTALA